MSWQKAIYEVTRVDTREVLRGHRTRQRAVRCMADPLVGRAGKGHRWPSYTDGPCVLIVEGTWHEVFRPDDSDPTD